jgi:hypothetical protein
LKIWINRAGQILGKLDIEEVQRGLQSGQYLPTDLGWRKGMENLKPLSEFPELRMPQAHAPAVRPPIPEVLPTAQQQQLAAVEGVEAAPAWERRQELGFAKALVTTWKDVLFSPRKTFQQMQTRAGYKAPLLFQTIMTVLAFAIFESYVGLSMAMAPDDETFSARTAGFLTFLFLVGFVIGVPFVIRMSFVHARILHFCLSLFRGTSKGYEATFVSSAIVVACLAYC